MGLTDASQRTDLFHHQVGAATSDTEQSHYPRGRRRSIYTLVLFCPSAVSFHGGTFQPVFCTTLLSPARWIFYEPGNVGFCVEDWNINMAFLRLELLFLLWYKSFQKTQIGQVATWTALFASLFLSEEADFMPASLSQTPDVQSTTCTVTRLDKGRSKKKKEENSWGLFFPLKLILQRMSHCLFPSCKFSKACTAYPPSEFTWAHVSSIAVFACPYYLLQRLFFAWRCLNKWATM